jgi:hypothetical protein
MTEVNDVVRTCHRALAEQQPPPKDPLTYFNNHMHRECELRLAERQRLRRATERRKSEAVNLHRTGELEAIVQEARPYDALWSMSVTPVLKALEKNEFSPGAALAPLLAGTAGFRTLFDVVRCASPQQLRALMRHALVHQPLVSSGEHLGRVLDLTLKTHADTYRRLFAQHRDSPMLADAHLHSFDVFVELELTAFPDVAPLLAVHPANFDTKHLECKAMDFRSPRDATLLEGTSSSLKFPSPSLASQRTPFDRHCVCC